MKPTHEFIKAQAVNILLSFERHKGKVMLHIKVFQYSFIEMFPIMQVFKWALLFPTFLITCLMPFTYVPKLHKRFCPAEQNGAALLKIEITSDDIS